METRQQASSRSREAVRWPPQCQESRHPSFVLTRAWLRPIASKPALARNTSSQRISPFAPIICLLVASSCLERSTPICSPQLPSPFPTPLALPHPIQPHHHSP